MPGITNAHYEVVVVGAGKLNMKIILHYGH